MWDGMDKSRKFQMPLEIRRSEKSPLQQANNRTLDAITVHCFLNIQSKWHLGYTIIQFNDRILTRVAADLHILSS